MFLELVAEYLCSSHKRNTSINYSTYTLRAFLQSRQMYFGSYFVVITVMGLVQQIKCQQVHTHYVTKEKMFCKKRFSPVTHHLLLFNQPESVLYNLWNLNQFTDILLIFKNPFTYSNSSKKKISLNSIDNHCFTNLYLPTLSNNKAFANITPYT